MADADEIRVDLLVVTERVSVSTERDSRELLVAADTGAAMPTVEPRVDLLVTPAQGRVFATTQRTDIVAFGTGPRGAPGPTGAHSESYEFDKGVPATVWNIPHSLGKYPSVTVVDSSGRTVEGQIQYIDGNNITLTFSAAFAGIAYLN